MSKNVNVILRERSIVSYMTTAILWAQPAVQQFMFETKSKIEQTQRSAVDLSKSNWQRAIHGLVRLELISDTSIAEQAKQLFEESSINAYNELQVLSPGVQLAMPEFLLFTDQKLREQVSIFYIDETV